MCHVFDTSTHTHYLPTHWLQVVIARWKKGVTFTVDNVHGRLIGADGLPFLPFGSYTYGVLSDNQRSVPETEVPFGEAVQTITDLLLCFNSVQ